MKEVSIEVYTDIYKTRIGLPKGIYQFYFCVTSYLLQSKSPKSVNNLQGVPLASKPI